MSALWIWNKQDVAFYQQCKLLTAEQLRCQLTTRNAKRRRIAAEALMRLSTDAELDFVLSLCREKSFHLRETAALLAGNMRLKSIAKQRQCFQILHTMALRDPSARVRAEALRGLGRRYAAAPGGLERLARSLHRTASDPCLVVRRATAQILFVAAHDAALPAFERLLHDPDRLVREWTVMSLPLAGRDSPLLRNRLLELLEDSSGPIRLEAAFALAALGEAKVLPALKTALAQPVIHYRTIAAISRLAPRAMIPDLEQMFACSQGRLRCWLAIALLHCGVDREELRDAAALALADEDMPFAHEDALAALARVRDHRAALLHAAP